MQTPSSCKMTARQAFHLVSAAITKAKTQDQVYRVFKCLCAELKVCNVRVLVPGLESYHVDVVDSGPNSILSPLLPSTSCSQT